MASFGEPPTPQELRVLHAVVEHGTMGRAATALGLAVATVDMYVDLLRVKSGRRYLPQLIGWAMENGWLVANTDRKNLSANQSVNRTDTPSGRKTPPDVA